MRSDPDTDGGVDLAEHVVATSESERAVDTVAKLLGVDEHGPDHLTESFLDADVVISADDFFLGEETRHEIRVGDRVEYAPCVADALQAAVLVDHEPVTVRSLDPVSGEAVTFEVADDDVAVTPPDAVVSIGMAADVAESDTMVGVATSALAGEGQSGVDGTCSTDAVCEYVNAFESREHYEQWATDADAVTVAVPVAPLVAGIRDFVAGPLFD